MTDDQHGEGAPQGGGRWNPLPQGDYDDGATAFVKLPEGGIEALLASAEPLAAPGHGYVPPQIAATPGSTEADPSGTGGWAMPAPGEGAQWPDPNSVPQEGDRFAYNPASTQQWAFEEPPGGSGTPPHGTGHPGQPGQDVTGQWSIPVADGDLPDESGEFTTSSLVQQWGGTPPATLPGGAAAPWATDGTGQPWAQESGALTDESPGVGEPHAAAGHAGTRRPLSMPPHSDEPDVDDHAGARQTTGAQDIAPRTDEQTPEAYGEVSAVAASRPPHGPGEGAAAARVAEGAQEAAEAPERPVEPFAGSARDTANGRSDAEAHASAAPDTRVASDGSDTAVRPAPAGPAESDGHEGSADDGHAVSEGHPDTSADAAPPPPPGEEHPLASYVLRVNGADRPVSDAWVGESLLYVLRERLGLAGAKDGCSQGECGACNVQVDGRLVASCLVPAVTAAGSEVRTVEGLAEDGQPSDVQRALARCGAVQCGFCVPGMAMTVHDLLEGNPAPTELEARQALCGNLCRCSGYRGVLNAVKEVVAEREAHSAGDSSEQDGDEARIPHQAGPGAGGINPSAFEPHRAHDQAHGQDGGQA
ncbi:2Fe-2S iron-sulfur cluster-binding protein [Streptomyces sp. NPDC088794]|uniref:2Fe-2S iron-sulfur cluster-binding protein n=1 Tax=Streptomyces sp. NPDC088794 TaxID=3365902 RepID=UPI00380BF385